MRRIEITIDDGRIEVWEDGKTTGQLSWDEAVGRIAEMTHPRLGAAHFLMLTPEEWDRRWQTKYGDKTVFGFLSS